MLNPAKLSDLAPPHPGEILREDLLERLALAPSALAGRLGLSPDIVAEVLAERQPVTAEMASRLASTFGHSLRFWIGLQAQYDLWHRPRG